MKQIIKRIERVNRSGTSKSGNAYHIDQTNIVVDVPYETSDGFGSKEMAYQYGDHTNMTRLEALRGKLPCEVEIELGTQLDQYDNPQTVVVDVKLPSQVKAS